MQKNPIVPFILIFAFGIGLIFFLSIMGVEKKAEIAEGHEEGGHAGPQRGPPRERALHPGRAPDRQRSQAETREDLAEPLVPAALAAARGEWESFQILVRADEPVGGVNVEAGDLTGYIEMAAGWNILVEVGLKLGINLDKPERARKVGNEFVG